MKKKLVIVLSLFCCALLLLPVSLRAQDLNISGRVVDADGEPVVGASVTVQGTTRGVITNVSGDYNLQASPEATLVFSFLGMGSKTEVVSGRARIDVTLEGGTTGLDEVVVVGYGVQKKKLVTGATVQVKGEELAKLNTTSPLQAMQGLTPGVTILSQSGQPGSGMKVTIRGLGTVGSSGPLYIIDGIEGDIAKLNAADIESIDVLKDAASAAIYGAQSANGVVLITTKQGQAGKAQVTFDAYYGLQNTPRKVPMLNSTQYMAIMNEQALNSGSAMFNFSPENMPDIYTWSKDGDGNPIDPQLINTNWIDEMLKENAVVQNYTLGISGGTEASIYALSLNYLSQEGIVGGAAVSNYDRYNFRINSEHKLYGNFLKVGEHLNFIYTQNTGINVGNQYNNTLRGAFATSPLSPLYSDNNIYDSPYNDTSNSGWYKGDSNPVGSMMTNTNNENDNQNFVADLYAELQPLKNLKIKSVYGFNYYASEYRSYTPKYHFSEYTYNDTHTEASQNMSKGHTMTWTNTASYDFTIDNDHAFNALIGMEAVRYQGIYVSARNWDLKSMFNDWEHAYIDNTENTTTDGKALNGNPSTKYRRVSYFGRVGYNYKEKYLLNATLRSDASSKFAKGNRWGYFPSVSAGWIVSAEDFASSFSRVMDYLKLRASWGRVGNQNIDDFQYAAPIKMSTTNYIFGNQLGGEYNQWGAYPERLANPNVTWETSEQINIGFDARLLQKLSVAADFYIKTTKDWLVEAPILATVGTGAPYINGGNVKNTGVELGLTWNDRLGDLRYSVGINGAYNKNVVGKIPNIDGIIHGQTNMLYDNSEEFYRAENGHPIGYFWGYQTAGIFQSEQDIADWRAAGNGILQANPKPGDVKYVDQKQDGKIDVDDKVDLGNGMPDFTYGLNIGLEYKNFDFSLNAYGMVGNKIVQSYRNHTNIKANYTTAILQRWTGEGTSNSIPRVTETNINWQFSDLYVHDADFLKISNITLGYDFAKLIKYKNLGQLRLYVQVQNAFTFTKYNGMDPEIGYGTDDWASGVDLGYYPRPRTILFGANIKF